MTLHLSLDLNRPLLDCNHEPCCAQQGISGQGFGCHRVVFAIASPKAALSPFVMPLMLCVAQPMLMDAGLSGEGHGSN